MSKRDVKENIIEALKRRQLLDYNRNNESYQMHPLVQEKASNLLSSESAYRTAHRQAYRYFLSIAKPEAEWKEFDDLKPLLRAHYHACQAQDWDEAAVAISRAYEYLRLKSYFYLLIDLYSKLIPTNWKSGEQLVTSSYIHCDALCRLGHAYHSVSQVKTADEYYQYSLIFAYKIRDRKRESIALTHIALNSIDNNQKAIDNLHKCLNIADEIQDYHLKYDALTYLGMLQGRFGNYHAQLEYFQKALEVADQNGLKREKAIAFSHVGCVYAKLGKYDIALEYNQQNLAVTIELENPKDEACARAILADIYNKLGRYETAINYAQSCLVIARKIGYKHCEKGVLSSMGISYRGLGDYQTSIKLFNQCLKLVIEIGDQSTEGNILCEIGINYRELGRIEASIENLQNSLIVFQKICNRADESRVLIELARSSYKTNFLPLKTIQNYLNQAEQICIELKLPLLTDVQKMKAELLENDR
jgi:tetratricopeptide (TPR) repeat protein